jgi:membrane-bound lytic murein transglycosylase D
VGGVRAWLDENVEQWTFETVGLNRAPLDARLAWLQDAASPAREATGTTNRADAEALIRTLDEFEITSPAAAWVRALIEGDGSPDRAPEASPSVAAKPQMPRDPVRLAWESELSNRPPPSHAATLLPELKAIFIEEGLPPELVWIAEVESGFDPKAQSRVGALGLFQLMPDTAEEMGLTVGFWLDERHDPRRSTQGAARYLRALQRQFQDWQLALAAYNGGPGRVASLLEKTGARDFAGIADRLPEETRQYVPRVEATLWVREGVELRHLQIGDTKPRTAARPITDLPASGNSGPG